MSPSSTQRLCSTLLDRIVGLLIRPELKVRGTLAGLADLPDRPRNLQTVEDIDMLADNARLVSAGGTKLLKEYELLGSLGVLERNGCLVPEL